MPLWDALNHVTGRANVRLHHCEAAGALQMIASRPIARGDEVRTGWDMTCPAEDPALKVHSPSCPEAGSLSNDCNLREGRGLKLSELDSAMSGTSDAQLRPSTWSVNPFAPFGRNQNMDVL